jgi:hypothetical protein
MDGVESAMRAHRLAATAIVALLLPVSFTQAQPAAAAQQKASPPAAEPQQAPSTPPSAESMGVSLKAIRNQARGAAPEQPKPSGTGMRYDFTVEVLGKRPPIDFFRDFDLSTKGGVRWGTPTHQEILNAVSPYWVNAARPSGSGYDVLAAARKKK